MTNIKSRGKRKDNSEWVKGFYFYEKLNDKHFILVSPSFLADARFDAICGHVEVIPKTVGQFINLVTHTGVSVAWWQGDILEAPNGKMRSIDYSQREGGFYLYDRCGKATISIANAFRLGWSRIGNVHDNPKLLK